MRYGLPLLVFITGCSLMSPASKQAAELQPNLSLDEVEHAVVHQTTMNFQAAGEVGALFVVGAVITLLLLSRKRHRSALDRLVGTIDCGGTCEQIKDGVRDAGIVSKGRHDAVGRLIHKRVKRL